MIERLSILAVLVTGLVALLGGFKLVMHEWRSMRAQKRLTGKWLGLLVMLWLIPTGAEAACTGASPTWSTTVDSASVQTCITNASNGDTINIAAGAATWTTTVDVPSTKGLTISGAGEGVTTITHGVVANKLMTLNVVNGNAVLSVGNFTVNANNNANTVFELYGVIAGTTTPCLDCFRFHHITVTNVASNVFVSLGDNATGSEISGLFDHITCRKTASGTPHCFRFDATSAITTVTSDTAFTWPLNMGSRHMTYVEDSTIDYSGFGGSDGGVDHFNGSQIVYRKNRVLGTELCGWHGSDSALRGIHSFECYRNTLDGLNVWPSGGNMRSGTGVTFQNTLSNYTGVFIFSLYRIPPGFLGVWSICDGSIAVDGNTGTGSPRPLGYPCLDQTGWFFGAGADPAFTLTPNYHFLNTLNGVISDPSAGIGTEFSANYIAKNTEFYSDVSASCSGASCTTGVGTGTLAVRPASCTTGVGYWATDQGAWNQSADGLGNGALYKCTATNVWTLYYTPYTYPHPLQGVGTSPIPHGKKFKHFMSIIEGGTVFVGMAWHFRRALTAGVLTVIGLTQTGLHALPLYTAHTYYQTRTASAKVLLAILPGRDRGSWQ